MSRTMHARCAVESGKTAWNKQAAERQECRYPGTHIPAGYASVCTLKYTLPLLRAAMLSVDREHATPSKDPTGRTHTGGPLTPGPVAHQTPLAAAARPTRQHHQQQHAPRVNTSSSTPQAPTPPARPKRQHHQQQHAPSVNTSSTPQASTPPARPKRQHHHQQQRKQQQWQATSTQDTVRHASVQRRW